MCYFTRTLKDVNHMGGEESALPFGCIRANSSNSNRITCQITIAIHGRRRMGKTCLLNRMRNCEVSTRYEPTPTMTSVEFVWTPNTRPDELVKITIWEVVDKAIRPPDLDPEQLLPDASTVDTCKRSDGIVVIYNPDDDETAQYAVGIVNEAPPGIPIIVLANFLDLRKFEHKTHNLMEFVQDRILHVQTSVLGMRGLEIVAKWLDYPFLYHKACMYKTLAESSLHQMIQLKDDIRNMSATVDADLFDARPLDESDSIDDAIPIEFREHMSISEFPRDERYETDGENFAIRLNYDM